MLRSTEQNPPPFNARLAKIKNGSRSKLKFPDVVLNRVLTRVEFDAAAKRQRADAAPGDDQITPAMFFRGAVFMGHLFEILKTAWDSEAPLES